MQQTSCMSNLAFVNEYDQSPLDVALEQATDERIGEYLILLCPQLLNRKNANGFTPSIVQAQQKNITKIIYLLQKGADLSIKDNKGYDYEYYLKNISIDEITKIKCHIAIKHNDLDLLHNLLQNNPNLLKSNDVTILFDSILGNIEMIIRSRNGYMKYLLPDIASSIINKFMTIDPNLIQAKNITRVFEILVDIVKIRGTPNNEMLHNICTLLDPNSTNLTTISSKLTPQLERAFELIARYGDICSENEPIGYASIMRTLCIRNASIIYYLLTKYPCLKTIEPSNVLQTLIASANTDYADVVCELIQHNWKKIKPVSLNWAINFLLNVNATRYKEMISKLFKENVKLTSTLCAGTFFDSIINSKDPEDRAVIYSLLGSNSSLSSRPSGVTAFNELIKLSDPTLSDMQMIITLARSRDMRCYRHQSLKILHNQVQKFANTVIDAATKNAKLDMAKISLLKKTTYESLFVIV